MQFTLLSNLAKTSEEKLHFQDRIHSLAKTIETMPKTHDQDGLGDKAVAHLHYFKNGCDWYITEKDAGSPDDAPEDKGKQFQAFGIANIGYGYELGYISIQELIENNAEIDLYFKPRTIGEIKLIDRNWVDTDSPFDKPWNLLYYPIMKNILNIPQDLQTKLDSIIPGKTYPRTVTIEEIIDKKPTQISFTFQSYICGLYCVVSINDEPANLASQSAHKTKSFTTKFKKDIIKAIQRGATVTIGSVQTTAIWQTSPIPI